MTHAVICSPRSVTRSVPRITVMRAALAASATVAHARSRNAGSGAGAVVPGQRYPGTKHSGKQMTSAPPRPASATAAVARTTDSSRVFGTRTLARAIRTVLTDTSSGVAQSATGNRSEDDDRLVASPDGVGQRRVQRLEREVVFAGEEPQQRPALAGPVIADGAFQHGVARFDRVDDAAHRHHAGHFQSELAADAGQLPEVERNLD